MRLTTLRLAGFKSFVEPTELHFPSELVGIVGPNGCGKSNTLDALRWVMGESSAKHLRGQSLDDVIFAGSGQRKPVAQASVELVFEHHDDDPGTLQGPWARFRDLSIRRVLTRDGQSKYFLNGTRCRRKDIADLFLGTGLGRGHGSTAGTRSYAIIEQGQINRLLEARPEELRATLEEAAGISRYKERRRETEVSMQHTRDNLARLCDLRDELGRQLDKLERQAKAAERFRQLQSEEQQLELASHAMQLRQLRAELLSESTHLAAEETTQLAAQQQQHQFGAQAEATRAEESRQQEVLHQAQARAYAQAATRAQLEQARRHAQEQLAQLEQEQHALAQETASQTRMLDEARAHDARIGQEYALAQEIIPALSLRLQTTQAELISAEQATLQTRQTLEQAQLQAQEPSQQLQLERARLEQAEHQYRLLHDRQQRLRVGTLTEETQRLEAEFEAARTVRDALHQRIAHMECEHDEQVQRITSAREQLIQAERDAHALHHEETGVAAELRALRSLEQAQSQDVTPTLRAWLKHHALGQVCAADKVSVAPAWADALDSVLTEALHAIPVESLDAWRDHANDPATHGLWLMEKAPPPGEESAILHGDLACALLGGLRPIDSLDAALTRRRELAPGDVWLTPNGELVGRHTWRRPRTQSTGSGALSRRLRLDEIERDMAVLQPRLHAAQNAAQQAKVALQTLETQHATNQRALRDTLRQHGESATRVEQLRLRLEQAQGRLRGQLREQEELVIDLARIASQREQHQLKLQELEQGMQAQQTQVLAARNARDQAEQILQQARTTQREAERAEQAAQASLNALRREQNLRAQAVQQLEAQRARLDERRAALNARQYEAHDPLNRLDSALEQARHSEEQTGVTLTDARSALAKTQADAQHIQSKIIQAERSLEQMRSAIEQRRLRAQALALRTEAPAEIIAQAGEAAVHAALNSMGELPLENLQTRLNETRNRMTRLGAVNLAALEEFEEARQHKAQLDAQDADLNAALHTLESAVRTMDQETRGRFRATFEAVNAKLSETFQQLFGGGEARLELLSEPAGASTATDAPSAPHDRWLDGGLVLLARPPGKKISHIHLLSGGEKSLTAIALIFAIFQLNPAPFCLLDEVDAPLDEANVGRFCAMVQAMSARVQFIFITHNKTTMELARQLIGVTMREAGVSRIVEVDLDAALKMIET
jgi:chromosome segregation protein